mgnify:CR=1 FL=1
MLEKIGHIKNPLTVIAMFAGIAEVSGTIVLPFLDVSIQTQYVWFLMGFPCFLVALFFFMLWKKHHVLYAPSDYKEDKSFMEAYFNQSEVLVAGPIYQDIEASLEFEACKLDAQVEVDRSVDIQSQESTEGSIEPLEEPVQWTIEMAAQESIEEAARNAAREAICAHFKNSVDVSIHAEGENSVKNKDKDSKILNIFSRNKVVDSLVARFGGQSKSRVEVKQFPNINFDAVIESSNICVVSFVDVTADCFGYVRTAKVKFQEAKKFWDTLGSEDKSRFVFHLALMFGPSYRDVSSVPLKDMLIERAALPFKTEVVLYEYDVMSVNVRAIL